MPHPLPPTRIHRPGTGPTLVIGVALALAAIAGCSGPASTGHPPGANAIRLTGAGSTFDAHFFSKAFTAYKQVQPGVAVDYASVGSSAGITRFTAGTVNFGATDVPASATDLAGSRGGQVLQVPVDLGAVSVAYNVPLLSGAPLRLTGSVLARIFLGQITRWNDPAITALNPGADLPNAYITVVHRSDGSGTTYIFTNYLSTVSPAWARQVGTGRSVHWPTGYGASGNPGVATAIDHNAYSIGYAERSYTSGTELGTAEIQDKAGNYVAPTTATITADADAKPAITPDDFSIVNEPGTDAYPICGYSWVLVSARQSSQPAGHALVSLLSWLTHAGQSYAAALGYVTLPPALQRLASTTLARITGPDGSPLSG